MVRRLLRRPRGFSVVAGTPRNNRLGSIEGVGRRKRKGLNFGLTRRGAGSPLRSVMRIANPALVSLLMDLRRRFCGTVSLTISRSGISYFAYDGMIIV
jgi:hypothetical protein